MTFSCGAIILFCLSALTFAKPVSINELSDRDMDAAAQAYKGINWDLVMEECGPESTNILLEATRMAVQMTNYKTNFDDRYYRGAAWNRFFVADSSVRGVQGTWMGIETRRHIFHRMRDALAQLREFPVKGKKNRMGEHTIYTKITYRCKEDTALYNKCAQTPDSSGRWSGPDAYTIEPTHSEFSAWTITFCPKLFKQGKVRYINDITKFKLGPSGIATFQTFEGVIIHEWMHSDIAVGFIDHIRDVKGVLEGSNHAVLMYGATLCYQWAWQWIGQGRGDLVNSNTAYNGTFSSHH